MATKDHLKRWVADAVRDCGGSAGIVDVAQHVWDHHEDELRDSGALFYTWQYDMRWAAHRLRRDGVLRPADDSPSGVWEIA